MFVRLAVRPCVRVAQVKGELVEVDYLLTQRIMSAAATSLSGQGSAEVQYVRFWRLAGEPAAVARPTSVAEQTVGSFGLMPRAAAERAAAHEASRRTHMCGGWIRYHELSAVTASAPLSALTAGAGAQAPRPTLIECDTTLMAALWMRPGTSCIAIPARTPVRNGFEAQSRTCKWLHAGDRVVVLETRAEPSDPRVLRMLLGASPLEDASTRSGGSWAVSGLGNTTTILGWVDATTSASHTLQPIDDVDKSTCIHC